MDNTDITRKILRYFNKVTRPVFAGQISLDIGLSLERTQAFLDDLEHVGKIRKATREELRSADARSDSIVYVLVGRPSVSVAHDSV